MSAYKFTYLGRGQLPPSFKVVRKLEKCACCKFFGAKLYGDLYLRAF